MTKLLAPIFALTALLLQSCAPATQTQSAGSTSSTMVGDAPALWRIADEDTTIWLFGTIHVLPAGFEWRSERIDAAIAASDELVIETVLSGDTSESAMLLMRLGVAPNLPPIAERIPAEHREQLAAMIARGPFPESFLNGLETWAASLMLVGVTLNDLGLDPENGVEEQLEIAFRVANKPISGFETPAQQLGYFDQLPEDAQRHFLTTVIDTPDDIRAEFDAMLEAWVHGDEAAIAATFDDELSYSEVLREALLGRRNADWARQIAARLDQPGTVFVAVGAGHLVGRDSVQDFLAEQGIRTQRVQ